VTDGGVHATAETPADGAVARTTHAGDEPATAADTDAGPVGFAPTTHRWGLEASPFVLGPILFTVGMAVLLGVVPTALPFWDLAGAAVTEVFG
jgi:hypothetical protein